MKIDIRLPFITIIKTDTLADMRRDIDKAKRDIDKAKREIEKREIEKRHDEIKRDIQFWSGVFGRFSKQECLHCGKELVISPIGSGYYIEKDGVVHIHCMNEYLERRKKQ